MNPRMPLYELDAEVAESVQLADGILLHLFTGFVDAGRVVDTISDTLLENLEHQVLAEFNVDELHDFRSRRPIMTFEDYSWTGQVWPRLRLNLLTDLAGQQFLMLSGPEPDMRWAALSADIFELCTRFGVSKLVTASGIPMAVPHTRETIITRHGNQSEHRSDNKYVFDKSIQVPGSFSATLEFSAREHGLEAFGFAAHVPHYFGQSSFPSATVEVFSQLSQSTGLVLPLAELLTQATDHLERISAETEGDQEFEQLRQALETAYDELAKHAVPSLDEIGMAVERFLAEQDGKDS